MIIVDQNVTPKEQLILLYMKVTTVITTTWNYLKVWDHSAREEVCASRIITVFARPARP